MNYSEREIELLKAAADATVANQAIYAQPVEMANLEANGLVVGNPAMVDPSTNSIAYGATPVGVQYSQELAAANTVAQPAAPVEAPAAAPEAPVAVSGDTGSVNGFAVGTGFEAPKKVSRGAGGNNSRTYPFEQLDLNGYIFVPATEKRPDPKKSLASTISSANKRFEDFEPRRYFKTFRAKEGQKFGSIVAPSDGAYIVRVEPPVEDKPLEATA